MKDRVKSILKIIFGNFLLAVSVKFFVLPEDILSGGVAGISLIVEKLLHINTTITIDFLMISTFILGYIFLGKEFAIKTGLSSIVYPIIISLLDFVEFQIHADRLVMVIFGAVFAGIGIGIVVREDASTGGTDVPSLIINKYTGISVALLFGIVDGLTAVAGLICYGVEDVMIGLIYIYLSNLVIDRIIVPKSGAVALFIISDEKEKICDFIHVDLYRGSTILNAKGGYTSEDREVIMTVVSKNQYKVLSDKIVEIDPYAFVIVSDAKDIKGEGFTYEYRV